MKLYKGEINSTTTILNENISNTICCLESLKSGINEFVYEGTLIGDDWDNVKKSMNEYSISIDKIVKEINYFKSAVKGANAIMTKYANEDKDNPVDDSKISEFEAKIRDCNNEILKYEKLSYRKKDENVIESYSDSISTNNNLIAYYKAKVNWLSRLSSTDSSAYSTFLSDVDSIITNISNSIDNLPDIKINVGSSISVDNTNVSTETQPTSVNDNTSVDDNSSENASFETCGDDSSIL